jgi:hypothetical protein
VSIRVRNKTYTERIVVEERGKEITLNPTRVDLYDVSIEKRPITSTRRQGLLVASFTGCVD